MTLRRPLLALSPTLTAWLLRGYDANAGAIVKAAGARIE